VGDLGRQDTVQLQTLSVVQLDVVECQRRCTVSSAIHAMRSDEINLLFDMEYQASAGLA
jgi:hypothetical protein